MVLRTVGVRATGEKTAREPDRSLTVWPVREMEGKGGGRDKYQSLLVRQTLCVRI